jgi:hypothetical protein
MKRSNEDDVAYLRQIYGTTASADPRKMKSSSVCRSSPGVGKVRTRYNCTLDFESDDEYSSDKAMKKAREWLSIENEEVISILKGIRLEGVGEICNTKDISPRRKQNMIVRCVNDWIDDATAELSDYSCMLRDLFRFLSRLLDDPPFFASISTCSAKEAKSCLRAQISKVQNFVREHSTSETDHSSLFEEVLNPPNHAKAIARLQLKTESRAGDQNLIMAWQAITASDVLRKLAANAETKCKKYATEIEHLKKSPPTDIRKVVPLNKVHSF